jgi:hypothetical protein
MYTIKWATNFNGFSKENPMDLQKFAQFYEQNIANRHFEYHTTNGTLPSFIIDSQGSNLPHLMGLQYWNNISTKQASIQYEHFLKGEWTLDYLQKADIGAWQQNRERMEFTPFLYNLLYKFNCTIKLVHPTQPSKFKNRRIDMIFQKNHGKLVFVLELREIQDKGIYKPTSISTYKPNDPSLRGKHYPLTITSVNVRPI